MNLPQSASADTPPAGGAPRRIVGVVVTFNRLELLRGLLQTLRQVNELDALVVVDNASTDGTAAWLRDQESGWEGTLHPVLLETNTGGAGGFHDGLAAALDHGADLVWLMDDDGTPASDCLSTLLQRTDLDFWGPAVVDQADPERLVFPIRLPNSATVVHEMSAVRAAASDGLIRDVVIPFNGVLVTRELVERIGLVRAEMFIWGDDHEYRMRAERAGARIATVVDAVFTHPAVGDLGAPMAFGKMAYNHSPSDLKHYCMARNNLVNLKEYRGVPHAAAFVAKTVWFYTFTRPSLSRLRLSAQAMRAGLKGDFTGHRRFLK